MSAPAMLAPESAGAVARRVGAGVLRQALKRVTPRALLATTAIALALDAWQSFEFLSEPYPEMIASSAYLSATIINLCMSFCIMLATFVADERVRAGATRMPAYARALVVGAAAGAIAQWLLHHGLRLPAVTNDMRLPGIYDVPGDQDDVAVTQPVVMFFEYLIWGSIAVFIYVNCRTALLAAARMNAAQVERARAQRRTLEMRLQALQARVEPQFLFNTLAQVRDLYEEDSARGARVLGDLIDYLRAALPRLRESGSTFARELDLVGAWLRIVRARGDGPATLRADASPQAMAARLPAMLLLPLIDHVLTGAGTAGAPVVHVAARTGDARLRIEVSFAGVLLRDSGAGDFPAEIRDRLRALYGARAHLGVEVSPDRGDRRLFLEIPDEPADGDHR
ncbi:MAG TPA: histidine kinase [Casimicrobiaceae bacterium]|nr:histidine kinase [Casimicrobiaceae bacterium]